MNVKNVKKSIVPIGMIIASVKKNEYICTIKKSESIGNRNAR